MNKKIVEKTFKVFALKNDTFKVADPVVQTSCVVDGEKKFFNLSKNAGRCLEGFKNDGRKLWFYLCLRSQRCNWS